MRPQQLSSSNWFGKASAGVIAGYLLTIAICGIFSRFGPLEVGSFSAQAQITMWLMAPVWALILSFCFLFQNGWRAWAWLGGANMVLWGILLIGRFVIG
ncbi:hypothetical protein PVT68_04605 [Microbulbifer bruguierae]|uniref:Iron uptake protein n=1 Tax=Microbulbifer bruguierae TaxID=3029061 RepID=A0ABY8NFW3_9GAMM|nr:hypothetical protein [Microbulbifer bruguierae]WGL17575.1 hypothetical protein PVT68_04605 [Microbulbifer bruguierae]